MLFLIRWVVYRYKRWHYYLFDLCYAAQVVLMLQLWLFPTNIPWIKARRQWKAGKGSCWCAAFADCASPLLILLICR